jgi:hypothetical protein
MFAFIGEESSQVRPFRHIVERVEAAQRGQRLLFEWSLHLLARLCLVRVTDVNLAVRILVKLFSLVVSADHKAKVLLVLERKNLQVDQQFTRLLGHENKVGAAVLAHIRLLHFKNDVEEREVDRAVNRLQLLRWQDHYLITVPDLLRLILKLFGLLDGVGVIHELADL